MSELTLKDRVAMVLKTIASIITWIVGLAVSLIRGRFQRQERECGTT